MEANEQQQNSEIEVLKSIYYDAFFESPQPRAWKGAARLPEFNIKVKHEQQPEYFVVINVKLPKSYPLKSGPILSIPQSNGLTPAQVRTLTSLIDEEAHKYIGGEAVFAVTSFAEDWFNTNVHPPSKASGLSLALEMQKRAHEEQKAMEEKAELLAKEEDEKRKKMEEELLHQIEHDARRREELQRQELEERQKARRRAFSDVTERPLIESSLEHFEETIEALGIHFDTVRLYHGRKESLGTVFNAEPVCEDSSASVALELYVVTIDAIYYKSAQGRKKIETLAQETKRLTKLQNYDHVQQVFAVKVSISNNDNDPTRIAILMEKRPSMTLRDLLQDCDGLREDRVKSYLIQICDGLRSIHDATLVHRAINASNAGLVDHTSGAKTVKLLHTAYYTKLHDLHKSESFGPKSEVVLVEPPLPDDWLFHETLESPFLYTRSRDMQSLGVLALQMVLGLDIADRYPNPYAALLGSGISDKFSQIIADLIKPYKKSAGPPSAREILNRLDPNTSVTIAKPQAIPINGTPMTFQDMRTPVARITFPKNSPETNYFGGLENRYRRSSRWRDDWEQLEVLGRGGFGSVVKARNNLDNNIYAVKKIRLRTAQGDNKIFREVNALSRLSHRYIVRYYTTWLEESEPTSSNVSSDSGDDGSEGSSDHTAGISMNKTPDLDDDPTSFDINELVLHEDTQTSSFPSIHFTSGDVADDSSDEEESSKQLVEQMKNTRLGFVTPPSLVRRTLYIQMEYVERQTLKERIAEGISEEEAWRLFQQIVDALVHMASLGILHRDIKLTNIFIDSNGDCKVGDFGLATSSLAVVDPSDVSPMAVATFSDMTLDVGTRLYIAPEILSKREGLRERDASKADLYSLGIVFFELNYTFSTETERIFVIENLRHSDVIFPLDWDPKRSHQQEIIKWLLQHEPSRRPTAIQLSQSPLLPPRLEDNYFKDALQTMTNPENRYYPAVLASMFGRSPRSARDPLYDQGFPETAILLHGVVDNIDRLFRLHGARDVDMPLLMPLTDKQVDVPRQVLLLDQHGEILTLPANGLLPFARLAARKGLSRIKRFHVSEVYRAGAALSHPIVQHVALFDIITPDTVNGVEVGTAELITLVDECLGTFPNLAKTYQIHVSHSKISEIVMSRIPDKLHDCVLDVLQTPKSNVSQKRAVLQKKGLQKTLIDELECLYEDYEDMNVPLLRLEKHNSSLVEQIRPLLKEVASMIALANATGIQNSVIRVQPLMLGRRHDYFKDGICFEVVNPTKRNDILALGGRYDQLISQFYSPLVKKPPFVAICIQISLERITSAIATFQSNFLSNNQRSYDYWSARRCDAYIVSFQPGHLHIRLDIAALLWRNGIRADLMYETGVSETNMEALADMCYNEGILFTIYPKVKMGQTEPYEFKVKSVLRGTEHEILRQDLVPWLQHQISEQKKNEASASGISHILSETHALSPSTSNASSIIRDAYSANADVQVLLPSDTSSGTMKKQRRQTKQLFLDRAYEMRTRLKNALQTPGALPMLAVDVSPAVFDILGRSDAWVTDDEAWRVVLALIPAQHVSYAQQVREAVAKRRADGVGFLMLFAVREERLALLTMNA